MKNNLYKILIGFVLTAVLLSSCSLDTNPADAVEEEEVFKTTSGNEKVLNGTWGYLMETFYTYANPGFGAILRTNDAMGSDVVLNTRYGFSSHYGFTALYGKGGTNTHSWNLTYKTINNTNNIIDKIDEATGNDTDKKRIKAQALALRGFMYLHLASGYAFAVDKDPNAPTAPIYLKPTTKDSQPVSKATVSELYKQSVADLEEALILIPDNYRRDQKYKIDKQVILGILSRAALYSREWEKAKKYSDELLEANDYLMAEEEYKAGFNDINNREWIWGHPQTPDQSDASYQFNFLDVTSPESYYFSFNADPYFKDLFDDGDYRKSMISWAPDPGRAVENGNLAWMRYAKFKFKAGQIADIVLMRTSEIYLINAEAKARLGDGDAINKLNALKQARHAEAASGLAGQELINEIWIERRKELFGEGFSLIDLIRNQQSVVRRAYPQDKMVDYEYEDENGVIQTKKLLPQGHRVLNFPDQSEFTANSPYYLYRIPDVEERENGNL